MNPGVWRILPADTNLYLVCLERDEAERGRPGLWLMIGRITK